MRKKDVCRFGIKTAVIVAVSAMVFCVFAGMNTQNVKAENFGTNIQVSGDYGHKPDIAVDSAGNIYVVWEDGWIYCANSTDGGNSFGTAVKVSESQFCDYPSLAVDANDNLHVAWLEEGYIHYAKSTNHGNSFSAPVTVSDAEASGIDRTGTAAFGNNVYIVWCTNDWNLSLDKSINGGGFGADVQVNDVGDSVRGDPAIAIGADEAIYVVWQDYDDNMCIAKSTDQGAHFGASVIVDDEPDFASYYPSVAAIGTSTVYVAWGDTSSGRLRVSKSTNSGASFGSSVIVSDADVLGNIWSSIAVHPCGKVFVAWGDDRTSGDEGMEIYFANSTDEGVSFGTDVKVNDVPPIAYYDHRQPSLAVGNDTEVYVVWEDRRGDKNQIWFAKAPDATWPSKITDLDAVDATANSVTLNWTAPGDNFHLGTATTYDIRYSTSLITDANWATATHVSTPPTPHINGTAETFTVTNLNNDTLYYFAIKTSDEIPNTSPLSNVVSRKTLDDWPPARVTNLVASEPTPNSVKLTWTAPGDNGNTGTATEYDIRYSTSEITEGNWADATQYIGEPTPSIATTPETFVVPNLDPGTKYYFALKTRDEVPNQWSLLSNVVNETTLINHPPNVPTLTAPANDTWTSNNRPTFTWMFSDLDIGDTQGGYRWEADNNYDFSSPEYISETTWNASSYYTPIAPAPPIADGIWYWRVKTMDNHDAWSNWSDPWVVKIDTAAPTNPTSCTELGGALNNIWQNSTGDPTFTWSGADDPAPASDVEGYHCYFGSDPAGTSLSYTTSASHDPGAPGEGTFYLRVLTRDNAGNTAITWLTIFVFKYDATPPTTNDNAPSGWQTSKPIIVNLTTQPDPGFSGVNHTYYKKWLITESEPADNYTEGTTITLDADGKWKIKYYSEDNATNKETPITKEVWIDTISPTNPIACTELGGALNNTWQNSTSDPSFTWSGADDGTGSGVSGYYYYWGVDAAGTSTDHTGFTSYDPSAPGEGTFYLRVKTRDNAGNNATWLTIFVFKYDGTPPTTHDNAPSGWQTIKPVNIILAPEADISDIAHIYCKSWLTTENEPEYTEGSAMSLNADGIWNIKYYSVDGAGNAEASKTKQVQIDTTSPTAVTLNQPTGVTKNSVTLTWSKNTDLDFKQYEIYKDSELVTIITDRNTTTYTVPNLSSGTTYYFKIRVVDNANLSADSAQVSATTSAPPEEEMDWVLIGGIIGIVVVIVVILIAVIIVKKKKGKISENP